MNIAKMTINELEAHFNQEWNKNEFRGTVTQLSKPEEGISLVKSKFEMFNFDAIVSFVCKPEQPSSVDGIYFSNGNIYLVEFKTGFYQKIKKGRADFDEEKAKCPHINSICEDYWKQFTDRQKKEIKNLHDSLKLKALETYLFLEKKIGFIKNKSDTGKVILAIVTDENGIDGMESSLSELADDNTSEPNVQNTMHRFKNQKDTNGNIYFYDEINVYSAEGFSSIINKLM